MSALPHNGTVHPKHCFCDVNKPEHHIIHCRANIREALAED